MDFSWSDEQLEFKRAVIEFARKELDSGLIEREQKAEFWALSVFLSLKNTAALMPMFSLLC